MGCISDCRFSLVCAIANDNTSNSVDWANYGHGSASVQGIHVSHCCGPLGNYAMFIPINVDAICNGCTRDCFGIGGSGYDLFLGVCRGKRL